MSNRIVLSREIGIDVGHRVPDHGSKCRNPHGHRYRIIATCEGPIVNQSGHEENGMIVDFGNVKRYMMDFLDSVFDHGFVVYKGDKAMMNMFFPGKFDHNVVFEDYKFSWDTQISQYLSDMKMGRTTTPISLPTTLKSEQDPQGMKIIVVDYVPTAENLSRHMFDLLRLPLEQHYGNDTIRLVNIRLYETPNGFCDYSVDNRDVMF